MKPTDRQRVIRFLGDPPAARTRDELMILLTGLTYWDEGDLPEADCAKVDAAEDLLLDMEKAGELSRAPYDSDCRYDLFGPPERPR